MTTETFTNEAQTGQQGQAGQQGQTIIINSADKKSNGLGVAGFVLALIAIILGWVPVLGWIIWLLGLIFSAIGIFRKPKGFAIAGLAISLIGLVLLVVVFGAVLGAAALSM
jgi:hypothetical protein